MKNNQYFQFYRIDSNKKEVQLNKSFFSFSEGSSVHTSNINLFASILKIQKSELTLRTFLICVLILSRVCLTDRNASTTTENSSLFFSSPTQVSSGIESRLSKVQTRVRLYRSPYRSTSFVPFK